MDAKYNKENKRQYNGETLDAARPQDFSPESESFTEEISPAVPQNEIGGRTKEQQDLCLKSIDLALDIVKLTAQYTQETVFKTAAMVLKYINVKKSQL
jgi:hypothetical protein